MNGSLSLHSFQTPPSSSSQICMSMRASMDFDEEQNSVPGRVPDYGAIFMSNAATKRECFKRKLFGLPASKAHFVKQVKSGMVLFLFEFERRELHGVFQACSDGAMDIVPSAFRSSGKQFPAQVKFTLIWCCSPLSENEFCDAIKYNYYSANKFNFGLSKVQVHRLLRLFSSRKLKDQQPQRQFTSSKVARSIGYSLGKVRRVVDGRFAMNEVSIEDDMDNERGSVTSTKYPGDSFGNVGGVIERGRFAMSDTIANEHKVDSELGPVSSNGYSENSWGKVGRVIDNSSITASDRLGNRSNVNVDLRPVVSSEYPGFNLGNGRFVTSGRLETEGNEDNGVGPVIPTEYPGLFLSNLNTFFYSGKPIVEKDTSLVQDQLRHSSTFSRSMEPRTSNFSYPPSDRDAIVTSTLPYDPDAPSIHPRQLSSLGVDHSSIIVQDCPPHNSYDRNIFPSFRQKSFPLHVEPKDISGYPNINPGFLNNLPMANPGPYEFSCGRTSMPLSGHAYSENRAIESAEGLSFPKSSLVPLHFTESGCNRRDSKDPSSYLFSPSKNPSFLFDDGISVASQDKIEDKIPWRENNEAFHANVPSSNEGQCKLQGSGSVEPRSSYYHESNSLSHDVEHYQNIEGMHSGCQKNRGSVFSRLSSAQELYVQENDTHVGNAEYDIDTSVDGVMTTLYQSHYQWARTKKSNPVIKRHTAAGNLRNNKQATFKLERDCLAIISKAKKMKGTLAIEENADQIAEGTPLVDFKRRSEVRKIYDEAKIRDCNKSAESEGSSSGQCKRRKLIRPDFSKNESSNDNGINDDTSENLLVLSQEGTVRKDNYGSYKVLVGSQENEKKLSQNVELQHMISQICHEHKNTDTERGSNCKGERKAESWGAFFVVGGEEVKEPSQTVIQNVSCSVSCKDESHNAEEDSSIADSVMDELSQDHERTDHCIVQQSSMMTREALVGIQENEKKLSQNVELLHMMSQICYECKNTDTERGSNCEGESKAESCGASFVVGGEDGKEPSQTVGIQNVSCSVSCNDESHNAEEDLSIMDSVVDELSQDHERTGHCIVQQSSLMTHKELVENGIAFGEIECGRGNGKELLQNVENVSERCPTSGEIAIDKTTNVSCNQNVESVRGPKELLGICVNEVKGKKM